MVRARNSEVGGGMSEHFLPNWPGQSAPAFLGRAIRRQFVAGAHSGAAQVCVTRQRQVLAW